MPPVPKVRIVRASPLKKDRKTPGRRYQEHGTPCVTTKFQNYAGTQRQGRWEQIFPLQQINMSRNLPSWKLTYPTMGKGTIIFTNTFSKGYMLVPWRVTQAQSATLGRCHFQVKSKQPMLAATYVPWSAKRTPEIPGHWSEFGSMDGRSLSRKLMESWNSDLFRRFLTWTKHVQYHMIGWFHQED